LKNLDNNIYDFYKDISHRHTLRDISASVGVNKGTIKRWELLKEVPPQYYFDLCRLDGIEVDYAQYSEKEKDQFFTNKDTARYCYDKCHEILSQWGVDLSDYTYIEPSAGDGSFYSLFPEDRRVGIDIEPRCANVIQSDFLLWKPVTSKNICLGNPPFGLRGNLALKFINHSATFSDFVCFIVPQLFDSEGKGSCKGRVKGLSLIHSEVIDSGFYYPGGKDVSVNVVFQIWSKHHKIEKENINLDGIIKIYSLSDGGTPGSTRNKKHLYSCDYYLPSTCFGEDNMKVYNDFEKLPHRRGYGIVSIDHKDMIEEIMNETDWSKVAFPSTNGAYNLRFNIIEKIVWDGLSVTLKEATQENINLLHFM
tara:strand:- start:161 stop:1255 length:1095 start_codon:yes stop_codon:yes gene_type:complete